MMLKLVQVHSYYGKSHVLSGVNLEVQKGELVTLLGRNGMGKTTTLKSIMGMVSVRSGSVSFNGKDITHQPSFQIYRQGIGYVPQGRHIFSTLTVEENLRLPPANRNEKDIEWVFDYFPSLQRRLEHMGNELSGGEQQMLAIARVLISKPDLLLLDEPSEGIAPLLVKVIMETLEALSKTGLTILLVDANLKMACQVGNRHYIMASGQIVCEATSQQIMEDEALQNKYFKI
jgi:branched-chain amino acid transport system ATP-binding protein